MTTPPPPSDGDASLGNLCEHGRRRRSCVRCLREWVDDLLDAQKWNRRAYRDLWVENRRLRRRLAEKGVEAPD